MTRYDQKVRGYSIENGKDKTELIIDTPKTKNPIREIPMNQELLKMIESVKKIVNNSSYVLNNDAKLDELLK